MNFIELQNNRAEEEALANYKPESETGTWWIRKEGHFNLSTKYKNNNGAVFQQKKAPLVGGRYSGEIKKEINLPEVQATIVSITESSIPYDLPSEVIWYGERELPEGSTHFILVNSLFGWRIIPRGFTAMGPANKIAKQLRELYPYIIVVTALTCRYTSASVEPIENRPKIEKSTPTITLRELLDRFGDMDIRELGIKINYNILEKEDD